MSDRSSPMVMPYVVGFAIAQSIAWVVGTFYSALDNTYAEGAYWRGMFLPMVALPSVGAWIAVEAMVSVRRPRLFTRAWSTALVRWIVLGLVGVLAAMLTIGLEGIGLAFSEGRFSDWWILGLCAPLITMMLLRLLPRASRGDGCPACGYDWRGLARCPECGFATEKKQSALKVGA